MTSRKGAGGGEASLTPLGVVAGLCLKKTAIDCSRLASPAMAASQLADRSRFGPSLYQTGWPA